MSGRISPFVFAVLVLQVVALSSALADEEPAAPKPTATMPAVISPPEDFFLKIRERDREAAR
jgi:hypothetical protein